MGIYLYFSNQLMPLAQRLQQNLMPDNADTNVLDAPMVIVPNMNLSKWIKLTLSRDTDVFMNVGFTYLEDGLWQLLCGLAPSMDSAVELFDRESLKILLFYILMDLDTTNQTLAPIIQYLKPSDNRAGLDLEMRNWQLTEELARLFLEYEYHRSDMIKRWRDEQPTEDTMEACQQWIYNRVQSLKSQLGTLSGSVPLTMAEYAQSLSSRLDSKTASSGKRCSRVHLFGLSQVSPFHIELLSRLKNGYDIHIYSLNPSREYWEDIQTPLEKKWIARKNVKRLKLSDKEWAAGDLFAPADHELLSAWGKPGRENIRLLCQLTEYVFDACYFQMPRHDTVLTAVNHGLLTLAHPDDDLQQEPLPQDTSLQITACPGIRREVETVYESILYNLQTDPDLCMTDIAVMVSDMSRYKPVVDSVFGRQPARITYNLVDASAREESVFAQAILNFMALARGTFSRKAVFDFLSNPCVMQRWAYTLETLAIWIQWADALGIFHEFENPVDDDAQLPMAGLFSWRQGLERLRLSRIMTPPVSAAGSPRPHFSGLVPFGDINSGDHRLLELFCTIIPALHAAVASFKSGPKSARQWRDGFFQAVDQFMAISPDMRGEEAVFQSLLNAFDFFVRYDALVEISGGQMLTAEALWAFVQSHLKGITGGQGDYLTGGVTVSALMPMRPIPFKIVYVIGLEEGRFPGRATDSLLDLRLRKRRIGDLNPADRNRYLFLEILISVQNKLYLSYVSRDLQKDRDLEPCSVVHQLRRHVEQQVLGGRPFKIQEIPINADSQRYLAPDAVNAWSDVMVNANAIQRVSGYRRNGLEKAAMQVTTATGYDAMRYDPDFSFPATAPPTDFVATVDLTIDLLKHFLLDPVAVTGRYHLGAYDRIDPRAELSDVENEPLASQFPIDYEIRSAPIHSWLAGGVDEAATPPTIDALVNEFDILYADLARRSKVPAGAFANHDRFRLRSDVITGGETLLPYILRMRSARQLFSAAVLGSPPGNGHHPGGGQLNFRAVDIAVPGPQMSGHPDSATVSGRLPWIWQAEDHEWHCLVITGSGQKPKVPDKYVIAPLLGFMAIAASGESYPWAGADHITLHVVYRAHVQQHRYTLTPKRCSAYLLDLIQDFFSPVPMVWLPFETVFGHRSLLSYIKQDDVDDTDRQSFAESMQAVMQTSIDPVVELYGAAITPTILDLARRRFRVFVKGV